MRALGAARALPSTRSAKSAALSAFEGAKVQQRFFGHLLTAMKCPSLIRLAGKRGRGRSRGRPCLRHPAGLHRRGTRPMLSKTGASPRSPLRRNGTTSPSTDRLTPREACLEAYLAHAAFARCNCRNQAIHRRLMRQSHEPGPRDRRRFLIWQPLINVLCFKVPGSPESTGRPRGRLLRSRSSRRLPPVQAALLDQILHRFGDEAVAEVTGRSRRVLRIADASGERLALRNRCFPPGFGQPRRDRRLHGGRQTHPRLLHGRRHRAQLSRRSRLRQHCAAYPLPVGTGLAGRPGDPGTGPHPSNAPGLGPPVPARSPPT